MPELPSKARVVIVGGGVIGCSIAYHLAKIGWDEPTTGAAKAGLAFDLEAAKGACSRDYVRKNPDRIASALKRLLISHTVAAGTAPTQASSTRQALATLGVVRTNGAGKNPSYTLIDGPLTRKLQEKLAA